MSTITTATAVTSTTGHIEMDDDSEYMLKVVSSYAERCSRNDIDVPMIKQIYKDLSMMKRSSRPSFIKCAMSSGKTWNKYLNGRDMMRHFRSDMKYLRDAV